jgi:pimeloyl-ACP methyl ester carboxylesterase
MLQNDLHAYAPDLMGLGDTDVDPAGRFDMEAQAEMLLELMTALGHERFGLVCHDQGGAAAQLLVARHPERVTCFGITDCVCYDNWPVPVIRRLQRLHQLPFAEALSATGLFHLLEQRTPLGSFRKGVYHPERFSDDAIGEYLRPLRQGARSRRRFVRFVLAGHPQYSLAAVEGLKQYHRPTLVVWAADDRYLSPSWGRKLYEDIPGAERFELVPFCGHFWQEEKPAEFVSHLGPFLTAHAA